MNLFASLLRRSRDRRAYGDLLQLDDRLLRDIGVTRGELLSMMASRRKSPRGHE